MMLDKLKEFLAQLDEKDFYKYLASALVLVIFIMAGIFYFNYRAIGQLKKRVARINNSRQTTQEILTSFERVKQQRAAVDAILNTDKQFRIVGALNDIIGNLGLSSNRSGEIQQTQELLEHLPEYDEIKIVVSFVDMNIKQLAELLLEIEKNPRIYTKELDIKKLATKRNVDVTLTIATLQARSAGTEME